jgi:lysozyme
MRMQMKISPAGIALIKQFEGCRLEAYKDDATPPRPTIGFGHSGPGVMMGQRITQARADQLLMADLERFEGAVNLYVRVPLTQAQFDSLAAWTFNCGVSALLESTLLKKLNERDYAGCSQEFLRWTHAGGGVLTDLVRRRTAERDLFNSVESA